jgi:peptide/nickel transport system substrate-binding protein
MNRRLSSGAVIAVAASLALSACSGSSSSPSSTAATSGGTAATSAAAAATSAAATGSSAAAAPSASTSASAAATTAAVGSNLAAENLNNSGTPVKGGTLHMLGTGDVDYMDPNLSYYNVGYLALRLWSRQLVTFPDVPGKTTTVVPDIATALPTASSDGLTYKITIKTGVKWDTTPARQVTAADEVRGIKRMCNPVQPFGGIPDFETLIVGFSDFCTAYGKVDPKSTAAQLAAYQNSHDITGVKVDPSNPQTVDITLVHPAAYFVDMLSLTAFSPAPIEDDKYIPASPQLAQNTISDGPYKITKYSPAKEIDFARNTAWDASTDTVRKAYVDNVVVTETGDPDSIQQQLEANTSTADMDFDASVPVADVQGLIAKKDPNFYLGPTFGSNPYIIFNTVSPNNTGALAKVAVRKALSEAINRANLTQDLNGPDVSPPLTHVLPAGISGTTSNDSIDLYKYDAAQAKKDLAAAGYPNGLTLKFLYRPKSTSSAKIFTTEQQDLAAAGIKLVGVGVPNADFYTKYLEVPSVAKAGTWDVSLAGWGPDWYGDAALSFFAPLFNGAAAFPPVGSNFGFYNNPTTNALIAKAGSAKTTATSSALWIQADKQVMEDAAIFPITADNWPSYHASHVHNTVFMPVYDNIDPANVWLSKS